MKVYYPVVSKYNQNDGIDWYWQLSRGSKDHQIHKSERATADSAVLTDYELLPKYVEGQFLLLEKASGFMAIAELVLTFAEKRK